MLNASYTVIRENWLTRKLDPTSVIWSAFATLVLALAASLFWENIWGAADWMPASQLAVYGKGEMWRLWSSLFAHADFGHLLSNCFLFFIVGIFLQGYFGGWVFPGLALLAGGLTNLIVLPFMPATVNLIGVSGVVYWMGGFWLVMYFMLERRKTLFQRAIRAAGVAVLLFFPAEAFDPKISYLSHVVGFFNGVLCAAVYFYLRRQELRGAELKETIVDREEDDPGSEFYREGSGSRERGIAGVGSA